MIPVKYRTSAEAIANYPYTDIASGLGYETFYLFTSKNGATISYHLSTVKPYSDAIFVKGSSFNFLTSTFNLPRTIKGDVYFDLRGDGGTTNFACSGSVIWVHADGTADTTLGTYEIASPDTTIAYRTAKISIAETNVKVGDQIKLLVNLLGDGNTRNIYLDPQAIAQKPAMLYIPFEVDT